jgi:replication-associated recombination protein RarA
MARPRTTKERQAPPTTALGYKVDEVASALQKEIRRSDIEAAVFWGLLLFKKSPTYAWKRVLTTASEDIGLAAPEVVAQVAALSWAWTCAKAGAWYASPHPLTLAIVLLCRAPKDTTVEDLQQVVLQQIKAGVRREMPSYAVDQHTAAGKAAGKTDRDWYAGRLTMIPANEWTRRIWELRPEWKP